MNDRAFCDHAAALAAEAVAGRFPHLDCGAVGYPGFGPGVVLFFGRDGRTAADGANPAVARLREFLAFEEVGIRELGLGASAGRSTWAMLAESRRDVGYCRRLVRKAVVEASAGRPASDTLP